MNSDRGQTRVKTAKCSSCGGMYPDVEGPTHRYMRSSPGCWSVYGEILAREYSNPELLRVHRLTVDTYAVQHPGGEDRQSIQSVGVHLVRLCLFLEHGLTAETANAAMLEAGKRKHAFTWLAPPAALGKLTAADIAQASTPRDHRAAVRAWAKCAWDAWSVHHATIRGWLPTHHEVGIETARRTKT